MKTRSRIEINLIILKIQYILKHSKFSRRERNKNTHNQKKKNVNRAKKTKKTRMQRNDEKLLSTKLSMEGEKVEKT